MFFHGTVVTRILKITILRKYLHVCEFKRYISQTHYEVLNLPESCSTKEIREAFITLSKQNHPDRHLNDPSMHSRFIKINEAYSILINPSKRRLYDLTLYKIKKTRCSTANHSSAWEGRNSTYSQSDPFMWQNGRGPNEKWEQEKPYYGVAGIKKVSNTLILLIVLFVTICGVTLQLIAIRSSFNWNHEQMLKKTQMSSLIHSKAQEKAKLYGNAYQIEILQSSTKEEHEKTAEEVEEEDVSLPIILPTPKNGSEGKSHFSSEHPEIIICEKCKKSKII